MNYSKLTHLISNQKVRYIITGGYNTVFGYLIFVLVFYYFSSTVNHYFLLGICHLIGTIHNFFSYSAFVFKTKLTALRNYMKFNLVYLLIFLLNVIMFTVLTKVMNWNLYFSQALIVALIAVVGYILNKHFSFANKLYIQQK